MKDEFSFINKITPKQLKQPELIYGIGDDAALFRINGDYDEVVCVDTMVENIHFRNDTMSPFQIGYKAVAVNISDVAAMGGIPLFYLVSIAIPKAWEEEKLYELYEGMNTIAGQYKMDLIGGDTVSTSDKLVISVTVIGKVEKGRRLLRCQAKPGDIVFITGRVGCSAGGLHLLFEKSRFGQFSLEEEALIRAHQMPEPQVQAGRILARSNYRLSLNDISDGLASEANEIAYASGVTIVIEQSKIPLPPSVDLSAPDKRLEWALFGGEDFQLIGTMSEINWIKIHEELEKQGIPAHVVGKVTEGKAEVFLQTAENLVELKKKGYNHFR